MRESANSYLAQVQKNNTVRSGFRRTQQILSFLVIMGVFWGLKLTGITMAGEAFCGMEEHVHTEACMHRNLVCAQEEQPGHVHTSACLKKTLSCTLSEQAGHSHSETCTGRILTCTQQETEGHSHGQSCFQQALVCTLPEEAAHTHGAGCYTQAILCGQEESESHQHGGSCIQKTLTCALAETTGHIHGTECYAETMTCTQAEAEGHVHTETCYSAAATYTCGIEEAQEHVHTEDCYITEEGSYVCGLEEAEGHSHTDECYEIPEPCTLQEHIHSPNCYSDTSADLETSDDWEGSLAGLVRSSIPSENMILVARSQLGMAESLRNFQVDELEVRRGITRYGQWYGNPYGDWSAMFVSFCLDHAGIQEAPLGSGPETMRLAWEEAMLYQPAGETGPAAGDLLFLDKDEDGSADAVAIVTGLRENVLFAVEGDLAEPVTQIGTVCLEDREDTGSGEASASGPAPTIAAEPVETAAEGSAEQSPDGTAPEGPPQDRVAETLYALEDPVILGYGLLPAEQGHAVLALGDPRSVWFDGTNGGLMSLAGSPNTQVATTEGAVIQLPMEWDSPAKYSYRLKGWYDVTNSTYYAPGENVTVTGNMVFYADWIAESYDIGQANSQVADTISTNNFVTVRMFDYGVLFNVLSERADVSFSDYGHTETWNLVTGSSKVPYENRTTIDYIFRDWDRGNEDISYPAGVGNNNNGLNAPHYPTAAGQVFPGLYTDQIRQLLFDPELEVIGKEYLGEGDHLFQLCLDPTHEHYGYYYYNSERNAASYNQSQQRFYVYDYLECTRTSLVNAESAEEGKFSDFLPLNSPYVNTNDQNLNTYTYAGVEGEYNGTTHYMYDCRYDTDGNQAGNVGTNFFFGMSVDVDFYLPNAPGTTVSSGGYGNQDIYGKDMHFRFSGDDDVWIFVDDVLVLDMGGIHGMESGDINFATGVVTVNGVVNEALTNNLKTIGAGEHTLSLYYLERGSSMANCAMYFNLAPRFSFSIQKEDALTRDVLNGAQFSVFTDAACTVPAELWTSKASHDRMDPATNVFTVVNGTADMWGMGAGNTYYIKETRKPDAAGYDLPEGIIELQFDKDGFITYQVHVIEEDENLTPGFTVHGIRLDEETQSAFIVATNLPDVPDQEPTSVTVTKRWNDSKDHSQDSVTVYLTVQDPDGTVRRIRELTLSEQINWTYTWENLPKLDTEGNEIIYGVEEALVPGYVGQVEQLDAPPASGGGSGGATVSDSFANGETYLLGTRFGYLATTNQGLSLVSSQEEALSTDAAQWVATVNGDGTLTLTNKTGQTLYYDNYTFRASSAPGTYKNLRFKNGRLYCHIDHGSWQETLYPLNDNNVPNNLTFNYVLYTTGDSNQALVITPEKLGSAEPPPTEPSDGRDYFQITNTPAGDAVTSFTVYKAWDADYPSLYETLKVQMKLLENGKDSGLSCELSLKNGWTYTFANLPVYDSSGNRISYSIEELPISREWLVHYGAIQSTGGSQPSYSTTVTNRYYIGGPLLPSTGTAARMLYILCGGSMMLTSLVYGIVLRRKRERRMV